MLPPFLGALLFLGTFGVVAVALIVALWARFRGNALVVRRALLLGGGMTGIYALFWLGGIALSRRVVLEPGQSVSFCGLDCHLHVSVDGVNRGTELGVTVRFSSNAVRAPEFPAELLFRLLDGRGREYAPLDQVPDSALRAGESWTHELHFPSDAQPVGAVLLVTWKGKLDYFVPGAGNPLVQRHRRLALPAPRVSGA